MLVRQLIEKRGGGELYTVGPDQTVGELIEALNERHVGAMVVVDADGTLLGIASERAVLRHAYDRKTKAVDVSRKVREIMRNRDEMPSVTMAARLSQVMELMQQKRTRHMVVVDERDKAITCVSNRDIVEVMLESAESENRELQNFMYGY